MIPETTKILEARPLVGATRAMPQNFPWRAEEEEEEEEEEQRTRRRPHDKTRIATAFEELLYSPGGHR
jgi:hypothetical protein